MGIDFFLLSTDSTYSRVPGAKGGSIFFRLRIFFWRSLKLREVVGWWWGGGGGDQVVRVVAASTSAVKVEGAEGDMGFNKSSSSDVIIHVRM